MVLRDRSTLRAVVTGGAGFIGSHVVDRLSADGCSIVVVDDLSSGTESNIAEPLRSGVVTLEEMDVRSKQLVRLFGRVTPDVVVHCAAQAEVQRSMRDPVDDAERNVVGTLRVLEAARANGVGSVVIASSGGTIYGKHARLPISESARMRPVSPYGISKRVLHDYAGFYAKTYGMRTMLLALGNVYGPRQNPGGEAGVVAIFLAKMLADEPPTIYGDGSAVRDYVYIDDVADAFARAVDSGRSGSINIGTGVGTSVEQIFRACARATGFKGGPRYEPARSGEIPVNILDVGAAATVLAWKPTVKLAKGLKFAAAYLSERAGNTA